MKQGFGICFPKVIRKAEKLITLLGAVLSQLIIVFLLNNNLAPIGSSVIFTCSSADLFEERERNVSLHSADFRGG